MPVMEPNGDSLGCDGEPVDSPKPPLSAFRLIFNLRGPMQGVTQEAAPEFDSDSAGVSMSERYPSRNRERFEQNRPFQST